MDSCFDLVAFLLHGVASCEVFSWSTDIHKPTVCRWWWPQMKLKSKFCQLANVTCNHFPAKFSDYFTHSLFLQNSIYLLIDSILIISSSLQKCWWSHLFVALHHQLELSYVESPKEFQTLCPWHWNQNHLQQPTHQLNTDCFSEKSNVQTCFWLVNRNRHV